MLAAALDDFRRVPGVAVTALIGHDAAGDWGAGCQRFAAGDEEASFVAEAARADATLVIAPECGGRLERRSRQVLMSGGRLLGCHPDAVRLTGDKLALARWWQDRGIATPPILATSSNQPSDLMFPLICKPRRGTARRRRSSLPAQCQVTALCMPRRRCRMTNCCSSRSFRGGRPALLS